MESSEQEEKYSMQIYLCKLINSCLLIQQESDLYLLGVLHKDYLKQ